MKLKNCIQDIRFWIAFAFILRMYGIANPPLEISHNWRQTTVTMVSRNFLEVDANIMYPRVDIAGEKSGITGMEFPLLNYLIYCVSLALGYDHWYGRLINLFVSSFGIFFFYKLILQYSNRKVAFYSAFVLLFSIWFIYSRKIMPDTFSMSFIIAALYFGSLYSENNDKLNYLLAFGGLLLIGCLSKLPSAAILGIVVLPLFGKKLTGKSKGILTMVAFGAGLITLWYYFHWVPQLVERYGCDHFFMGKTIAQGFTDIRQHAGETFARFYDNALKYTGFTMFLVGLYIAVKLKVYQYIYLLLLALTGFSLIIFKAGFNFYHHAYYIIPFVPVMALIAGYGISQLKKSWLTSLVLAAIVLEGTLNHLDEFIIKPKEKALLQLENCLDSLGSRNERLFINSGTYPTPMYFAHRKGWIGSNEQILDSSYRQQLKQLGLVHIVILKQSFGLPVTLPLKLEYDDAHYSIYKP